MDESPKILLITFLAGVAHIAAAVVLVSSRVRRSFRVNPSGSVWAVSLSALVIVAITAVLGALAQRLMQSLR